MVRTRVDEFSLSVIEGVEDALFVTDADLCVLAWNGAMERLTGVSRAEAHGRSAETVLPFLPAARLATSLRRALEGEIVSTEEFPYAIAALGREGWMRARYLPWRDPEGAVVGLVAFLVDVTDRRRNTLFLQAIQAIGQSLTSSLDLDRVLDTITGKALEVMSAESVLVVSWDGTTPEFRVMRAAGRLSNEYATKGTIPVGGGPISRAVLESRPVTTANILTDPNVWLSRERREQIEKEGYKAAAAAPLASKGRVHGALVVHYWTERTFDESEIAALTLLAESAALAIDNARLYADATRRADRLRELAAVEQLVAESLDLDDVLRRIAQATARLLDAPFVQVWTLDPSTRVLRRQAANVQSGLPDPRRPAALALGEGIVGAVAEGRMPVYIPDVTQDPRPVSTDWVRDAGLLAMLVVPILSGEEVLGVLSVHAPAGAASSDEDHALVISLATHAAAAMQNARLYADALGRASRLRGLVDVSQAVTSLETTDAVQRVAVAATALAPGALASVHILDRARGLLGYAAHWGLEWQELPPELPPGPGLPWLVVEARRPVAIADPANHPRTYTPEWWRRRPGATYYGVPIEAGGELLGVLGFVSPRGQPAPEVQEELRLLAAQAGIALRNASLYQTERVNAARIRALATVNRRISSALELDELLHTIAALAAELAGTRFASFWLADEGRRTLTFTSGSAAEMLEDFTPRAFGYDRGGVGWVARHRVPLVVDDMFADDRFINRAWLTRWGLRGFAAYPVLAGDELLAVMALGHSEPIRFGAETRDIVEMFLAQAAVAIQNGRLYREAQRRRDVAEVLSRLARQLTASLEVERIAELLVSGIVGLLLSVRGAAVYRWEPEDGTLHVIAASGVDVSAAPTALGPSGGVAARAIAERKIVTAPDGAVSIPLHTPERLIGALSLVPDPEHLLSPDDLLALEAVADQAALAFENARLYATARDSVARLRDTQMQLVQAAKMSALGQLVSGVAHELNNPLSVIFGWGQILLSREVPPAMRRPLELIVSQAERMAKIVKNLLFFSRQRPPARAAVNLNEVIEQALGLRLNHLALSGIRVERDLAPELPPIAGDPTQLEQVFLNLLLNAEQALRETKQGGCIVLRTTTSEAGRAVKAQVIDDGPGIPEEALPHVFEPFFTTKEVGTGTGLGLSVSYGIVEEHGGRLSVESRPGETVFALELPAARPGDLPTAEPAPEPLTVQGEGRLALVVEDEPGVRDLVVTLLGQTGWRVEVAAGGRAGLERVRARRYDLIVSDVRMPEGGGEEFYRSAIALDESLQQRFVFITGDTANRDTYAVLRQARVPVIEKPFQTALFLDAVRRVTISLTRSGRASREEG